MECLPESEEENILRWLEADRHVRLSAPGSPFCLGVELRDGGKLIGYLSLSFIDDQRLQITFSSYFHADYAQTDLLVEGIDALVGFCFEGIKLHRITSRCYSGDTAACKTLEEVGFRREGEFVKETRTQDGWVNSIWYALLQEEYLVRPPASP
jgi:RimJ/RimL family protein N-acetyltransferase